jgi:predicted enzyme related to lactoylglutathione lyase
MANPVTWFEIIGKDAVGLQKFYKEIFDWKLSPPVPEMGMYSMLDHEGQGIAGGIGQTQSDQEPGRVTIYIQVDDPQKYLDKVGQAGGTTVMPVMTVTEGVTIAMFKDPAGHIVGLLKAQ